LLRTRSNADDARMTPPSPVLVATDLTETSRPALLQGRAHAVALGAPLVVCHVVPDVFRQHPLIPDPSASELGVEARVLGRAVDIVTEQVEIVLGLGPSDVRVVVETGTVDEEIVALGEQQHAQLLVVGGSSGEGANPFVGHVAEQVVRYAHTSVLVAREPADGAREPRLLATTDFSESSVHALEVASKLAKAMGASVTLLHVSTPPSTIASTAFMPFGDTWTPPSAAALAQLDALGLKTLEGLANQYGFAQFEQLPGDPEDVIAERAESLDASLVVVGSRGRKGLSRFVLGSVAESVIAKCTRSVFVVRD
jgi:nucleotide-binding universal stress UspA family protein